MEPLDRLRQQKSSLGNHGPGPHIDPNGQRTHMHHSHQVNRHAAKDVNPVCSLWPIGEGDSLCGTGKVGRRGGQEEEQMIAANRYSLVENIGELVASAMPWGEGQFPFPSLPDYPDSPGSSGSGGQGSGAEGQAGGDVLTTIRKGPTTAPRPASCDRRGEESAKPVVSP
ncbi:hypothetical protein NHX12_006386 [Muraenolepis orangiensis]|uniref:Uncharacterized protein n=1 Tax=Muraenolepis orangiensis TaxID=630683 RepID=A0A9Q0ICT5_9TELE|nr:hypothetical protein NHX12_006386 [Muraenolepis orangiensis]